MIYNPFTCDLIVGAQCDFLTRLNLESGAFAEPLELPFETGCNSLFMHEELQILFAGGNKSLTAIDLRSNELIHQIPFQEQVTSLVASYLNVAVGFSSGAINIFDLRKTVPVMRMQHQYRLPIKKMVINEKHNMLVSSDAKIMKFYHLSDGSLFTSTRRAYLRHRAPS